MAESPQFAPERIVKTAGGEKTPTIPSDPLGIDRIQNVLEKGEIVGKMNGMDYKYIFVKTQTGWSFSEERTDQDGTVYYQTINMRNGKFELVKNTVSNGKGSPGRIDIPANAVKDIVGDFLDKIIILKAGKQISSLNDSIAFA
ncbi:hypothetical protein KBC86_02975 [Candidatus Gracilibacteria bacterium]|nr:hypothetical protein [Candidatus Gracilibacteria bacterium]